MMENETFMLDTYMTLIKHELFVKNQFEHEAGHKFI